VPLNSPSTPPHNITAVTPSLFCFFPILSALLTSYQPHNSHLQPTTNHNSHAPNISSTPNVHLMSSPHSQPENAAYAVLLSAPSSDPVSGSGPGPASASASDPDPAGQPTAAQAVLLSRPPAASSGEATPSPSPVDVDQSLHHAAPATPSGPPGAAPAASQPEEDQHKKTRPAAPNHNVSQQGPSLLTRALASARGIATHASSQPSPTSLPEKRSGTPAAPPADTAPPPTTSSARINASAQPTSSTADKQHDAHLQHGDNASLAEPRPPLSSTMAAPATIPATPVPVSRRDATSVPSSFTRSNLTEVRDMFYENRRPADPTLRRSSTSLDIDRRISAAESARALLHSGATDDESTTPTKASYLMGNTLPHIAADAADAKDAQNRPRPPLPEHRFTLGPEKTEKIWSIGSREGLEEDGLVEKSVTEAMTGVEHNARSRKASYSLRFFKEGLPQEEKGRRKDKDSKSSQREKLPATAEEDPEERWRRTQLLREIRQRRQSLADEGQTRTRAESPSLASQASMSLATEADTDYFSLEKVGATHQTTPTSSGTPPPVQPVQDVVSEPDVVLPEHHDEPTGPAQVVESPTAELRRHSGDSTEHGESHDDRDADESGEEKISSAVFVPHQEAGEARPRDLRDTSSGAGPRPRSIIQDESHHWLVKADEPEPQSDENEELPGRLSRLRSIESLISVRGDLVSEAPSEEYAIEGEEEVANQFQQAVPRVDNHNDDHVHDHQHISRPLEAIELIPYKHQVGGHTTLWRFSRRAVCKQLNNRENEFYETIERYHRDLLTFLPRYVNDAGCLVSVARVLAIMLFPPLSALSLIRSFGCSTVADWYTDTLAS
jgi:inositol-hexakisphosphate 5-kinase